MVVTDDCLHPILRPGAMKGNRDDGGVQWSFEFRVISLFWMSVLLHISEHSPAEKHQTIVCKVSVINVSKG